MSARIDGVDRHRDRGGAALRVAADLLHDLVHGFRLCRRAPVFAVVTVLILSLGIGVSVWMFSLMNGLLFRTVSGVDEPGRLVAVGRSQNGAGFDLQSYPNLLSIRERNTVLSALAVHADLTLAADAGGETSRVQAQLVSANFFAVVGVRFAHGRGFSEMDDRPGSSVAVVSADYWRRTFGAGTSLDGATVRVNRTPFQIVGVASPEFKGLTAGAPVGIWLPLGAVPGIGRQPSIVSDPFMNRAATWLWAVGRLRPGVSIAQARLALRMLGDQLAIEFPGDNDGRGIAVESIAGVVSPGARATLRRQWTILNALAAVVLLVVCFNVANMLMVRASARAPEMALRRALGAGRPRLVRQVLAEHIVLALSGGAGGALLAWWASGMGAALVPQALLTSSAGPFAPDWRVFVFAASIVLASSVISSVPSAWAAARADAGSLASVGTGTRMTAPGRLRAALAVLQVALSLALLVSGILLGRSLLEASRVDLGFQHSGVVTAYFDLDEAGYTPGAGAILHHQLLDRARTWSGVESVSLGAHVPLRGASLGLPIEIATANAAPPTTRLVRMNVIAPHFFRTLRTPVLRGREFLPTDVDAAPHVALVNEACRLQCFGGEDPMGRRIRLFQEDAPREIVGVVTDSKYAQPLEDVRPTVFVPVAQHYWPRMALLVRTSTPDTLVRTLPAEIRRLDPALPLDDVRTLEERLDLALWQSRMMSAIVAGFGLLSLVLAGLGVYGVVAQTTEQRGPEIAVRMALGAAPEAIVRMVLRGGLRLVAVGGAIGVALALAVSGVLQAFLYRVDALDPVSFVAATVVLGLVAVIACLIPARRAAARDPGAILRC